MFSLTALILTALISLIIGGLLGYLILDKLSPQSNANRALEARLQATEQQLTSYQSQVVKHFEKTSELVNNLTNSYKDVHEHLATGAASLANPEVSQQFIAETNKPWIAQPNRSPDLLSDDAHVEPPKDWAPEKGTLSEGFGFDSRDDKAIPSASTPS